MGNGITTQTSHQRKLKLKIGHGQKWHGHARKHRDPVLTCCPGKHKSLVLPGLRGLEFCLVSLAFSELDMAKMGVDDCGKCEIMKGNDEHN